jgi:CheY-like chemotaxis protein
MSGHPANHLNGLRVLVAEDNSLVADMLRDILQDAGCHVVGPAPRLAAVMHLIESQSLDGALLDVSLYGVNSFAAAWRLLERGVPFAFMSGYPRSHIPGHGLLRTVPFLAKPLDRHTIVQAVAGFLAA